MFRPETEAYTIRCANLILDLLDQKSDDSSTALSLFSNFPSTPGLRILDLCTGTGCIPLLLHAILSARVSSLDFVGVDISPVAITLANQNLHHNIANGSLPSTADKQIRFVTGDIFNDEAAAATGNWDIVISNPPYISPQSFNKTTSRSVRNHEPKSALVPTANRANVTTQCGDDGAPMSQQDSTIGDSFYPQILQIAARAKARMVLVEVADFEQAKRVAGQGIRSRHWHHCEIWRDWPVDARNSSADETTRVEGISVRVSGEGHGRSVLFFR